MVLFDRDKVLKLLVELLSSPSKELIVSALRLTHLLMLKYEWRVSFATEGGVKAILSCMQELSTVTQVQQLALAVSRTPHTHTRLYMPTEDRTAAYRVRSHLSFFLSDFEGDHWSQ